MPVVTIRNVPEEVHRAIRVRAAQHGRSAEAEMRDILERAARPEGRIRPGDALANLGRELGLTNKDAEHIDQLRDRKPAVPMSFEG
jgi:plasmid stability protein